MARRKDSFKSDTQLQNDVLRDRLINALTILEIAQKYPQYSQITYKRYLNMVLGKEESEEIERRARRRKRKIYSENAKRRLGDGKT